jgi:hypothetical protein
MLVTSIIDEYSFIYTFFAHGKKFGKGKNQLAFTALRCTDQDFLL